MKQLLIFVLTLCSCMNLQAKESKVLYKIDGVKSLITIGTFENGYLTEGRLYFSYNLVMLKGTYSPSGSTFKGSLHYAPDKVADCYGIIYNTADKRISKKSSASEWMIDLHLYTTINNAKVEFDNAFAGATIQIGEDKSLIWKELLSFTQKTRESKDLNATIYFPNGNKYIGPIHWGDSGWEIGKYGCKEYLDVGYYNPAEESFNISYTWSNGDHFEGSALLCRDREDGIIPISGTMIYNNGSKNTAWRLWSKHYKLFTFDKNPSQLKEELNKIEERERQEAWAAQQRRSREIALKEKQRLIEQQNQQKQKEESENKEQMLIQKYGDNHGKLLAAGKLELGMTKQMCQEVVDIKCYDIGKSSYAGHIVETWTFNKEKQDMQVAAAMTQLSGEEAVALALLMGFADSIGASNPKYSLLVFTDGKLTGLY